MSRKTIIPSALAGLMFLGCNTQFSINGMICPEGHSEARVRADFAECRNYNLDDATKASISDMSVECKECLEKKGYKIEK